MRLSSTPNCARIPNSDLQAGHKDFVMEALLDLGRVGRFKEQLQGLLKIAPRLFDRVALAGNIDLSVSQ